MKYHSMPKQKRHYKTFTNFRKIFGKFSVNFRQTINNFYQNKYPTMPITTLFEGLSFKTCQDLMVPEFKVQYAFSRSNTSLLYCNDFTTK